mmetsp:Transcript_9361/g.42616  ORF Transcript_9361/g.42616 Transcript_9361/m.42616 type:complete len:426 (+) Transcript_9361:183-1460(+)
MQALSARHALLGGSPGIRTSPTARSVRRARPVALGRAASTGAPNSDGTNHLSVADLAAPVLRSHGANEVAQLSAKKAAVVAAPAKDPAPTIAGLPVSHAAGGALALATGALALKNIFDRPSRAYVSGPEDGSIGTVGEEYDAWTEEGILEYYWGEHIHLGWYTDEDMAKGAGTLLGSNVKDFIEAKFDFVDKMLEWSECPPEPPRVLDVGCGIGGTSRHLAKSLGPNSKVQGITLSPNQVKRATELAAEQNLPNASFRVMNALAMDFPDDTFDLVWACESGEHMPDKKKYVEEMVRVLKPGGRLVIATWCQRSTPPAFTDEDLVNLDYLYKEWAHPYFISIEDYASLVEGTTTMKEVDTDDWTRQTIASWRHSVWAGVWDPIPVFSRPNIWYKTLRDIVCLERMRRAFGRGLMQYGMIKGVKAKA